MSLVGRILGRFGYVKLDPYRRALLADAEAQAGLTEPVLPPALPLPERKSERLPVPLRRVSRAVPPPLPEAVAAASRASAPRTKAPAPEPSAPAPEKLEAAPKQDESDEWEWRLVIARARAREAA